MGNEAVARNQTDGEVAQTKLIHVTSDLHTRLRVEAAQNGTTLRRLTETIIEAWFNEQNGDGHKSAGGQGD